MPELPTTTIGLIAFLILAFGAALKYLIDHNRNTVQTFMTYIEKKNANLERTSREFSDRMDLVITKHQEAMDKMLEQRI